jgi:hypothetical protein
MVDVVPILHANRAAVDDLIDAAGRCGDNWTTPAAPGKWSPSQIVEHVARSLEEASNVVSGMPSKFLHLPLFLRPLVRVLFFNRVVRRGGFLKSKTTKALNPAAGPVTPVDGRARLEAALARFERECRTCSEAGRPVTSSAFGTVPLADYARFVELHTRHHRKQMPVR